MREKSIWNWNITKSNKHLTQLILPTSASVTFGWLIFSKKLKEQELSTSDEIIEEIMTIWNDVTFEELQSVFSEWIQRVAWVIGHGGSITMNGCRSFLKEFSLVEKYRGIRSFWTSIIGRTVAVIGRAQ
jgi:hypothetical protein